MRRKRKKRKKERRKRREEIRGEGEKTREGKKGGKWREEKRR